jgi:hypothetical protein
LVGATAVSIRELAAKDIEQALTGPTNETALGLDLAVLRFPAGRRPLVRELRACDSPNKITAATTCQTTVERREGEQDFGCG